MALLIRGCLRDRCVTSALALALLCSVLTTAESQTQGEARALQSADETPAQGNDRASRRLMRQEARDTEVPVSLFGTGSSDSEEDDDEEAGQEWEGAATGEDGPPGGTRYGKEVDSGKFSSGGSFVVTEGGESQCPPTARIAKSDECKAAAKELNRKFFKYSTPYPRLPSGCSQVRGLKGMVYFNGDNSQSMVARGFVRLICIEKPESLVPSSTTTTTTRATTSTTTTPSTTTTDTAAVQISASSSKDNVTANITNTSNGNVTVGNATVTIKVKSGIVIGSLLFILFILCLPCLCVCTCCSIYFIFLRGNSGKGAGAEGEEDWAEGGEGPMVGSYVLVVSLGVYGTVYSGPDENQLYTVTFEDGTFSEPLLASDLQAVDAEGGGAEAEPAQEEAAAGEAAAPTEGAPEEAAPAAPVPA